MGIEIVAQPKTFDAELEVAENNLRQRAKELVAQVETTYWELAKALYEVFDGVPGGYRGLLKGAGAREARVELFRKWGYSSFEDYVEREVNIKRRSASSLRYAYYWFAIELDLPTEIIDRLKKLGRSKVYLMSGWVSKDNVISWLDKAFELTYDELKKSIDQAKAVSQAKSSKSEQDDYNQSRLDDSDSPRQPPAPEATHTLSTSLYSGQWDTWQAAFDRAKNVTNSDKISHNLEMICLDYLSSNDFADPKDDLKRSIAKFEKLIGHKLIAIDTKTGKPVYGGDLLWLLVKERVEYDAANPQPVEKVELTGLEPDNVIDLNKARSNDGPSF